MKFPAPLLFGWLCACSTFASSEPPLPEPHLATTWVTDALAESRTLLQAGDPEAEEVCWRAAELFEMHLEGSLRGVHSDTEVAAIEFCFAAACGKIEQKGAAERLDALSQALFTAVEPIPLPEATPLQAPAR